MMIIRKDDHVPSAEEAEMIHHMIIDKIKELTDLEQKLRMCCPRCEKIMQGECPLDDLPESRKKK